MMRHIWFSRYIEQVHAHKDRQETAEEGDGIDSARSVEALEEDGGGDDGGCGEEDVVDWVDPVVSRQGLYHQEQGKAYTFVEKVSRARLKKFWR